MADQALELREILDSAERAASAQDFASAERYLRQAASLQEAQLGSNHPDLGNTLNNLGIVCERIGKPDDAEAYYRRAYAIASATLPPEDALVLTSRQNLRDFCAATGRPFEPVAAAPPASSTPPPETTTPSTPVTPPTAPLPFTLREPVPSSPSRVAPMDTARGKAFEVTPSAVPVWAPTSSRYRRAIWVVAGGALVVVLAIVLANWLLPPSESVAPAVTTETPSAVTDTPREQAPPPVNRSQGETAATAGVPDLPKVASTAEKPAATQPSGATERTNPRSVATSVSLVETKLCRALSNWRCTPATSPAEPGVFFFYTRVKSPRDTTVQHRWYLNGNLRRSVDLRIGANPGQGYRTYSRNTVAAERSGNWTIELRDAGGALLHEERFVVQ